MLLYCTTFMRSFTRGLFTWLPEGVMLGKEQRRHHQQDKDRQDWRKEENLCQNQMSFLYSHALPRTRCTWTNDTCVTCPNPRLGSHAIAGDLHSQSVAKGLLHLGSVPCRKGRKLQHSAHQEERHGQDCHAG